MNIYLMVTTNGQFAKIGISENPMARLQQLNGSCPLELIVKDFFELPKKKSPMESRSLAIKIEHKIFSQLEAFRVAGKSEWFWLSLDTNKKIESVFKTTKEEHERVRVIKKGGKEVRRCQCCGKAGIQGHGEGQKLDHKKKNT